MESRRVNKQQRENFTDSYFQQRTIFREPVIRGFVFRETFHISHAAFQSFGCGVSLKGPPCMASSEENWRRTIGEMRAYVGRSELAQFINKTTVLTFKVGSQALEIKALPTLLKTRGQRYQLCKEPV